MAISDRLSIWIPFVVLFLIFCAVAACAPLPVGATFAQLWMHSRLPQRAGSVEEIDAVEYVSESKTHEIFSFRLETARHLDDPVACFAQSLCARLQAWSYNAGWLCRPRGTLSALQKRGPQRTPRTVRRNPVRGCPRPNPLTSRRHLPAGWQRR